METQADPTVSSRGVPAVYLERALREIGNKAYEAKTSPVEKHIDPEWLIYIVSNALGVPTNR